MSEIHRAINNDLIRFAKNRACNSAHTECKKLATDVLKHISSGVQLTYEFMNSYINFLTRSAWKQVDFCIDNEQIHKPIFDVLLDYIPLTTKEYSTMGHADVRYIVALLKSKNIAIDDRLFNFAIYDDNIKLLKFLVLENIGKFTDEHLIIAIERQKKDILDFICNTGIEISNDTLNLAIEYGLNKFAKSIIEKKSLINETTLRTACEFGNDTIVIFLLENKVIPTQKCLHAVFESCGEYEITVELLINYGYIPTYEDVLLGVKYKVKIENIERFNIPFDEKYVEACASAKFYPYKTDVKGTVKCLEEECVQYSNSTKKLKQLIDSGIVPNTTCLENACNSANNIRAVKLLVSNGAKPNLKCVQLLAKAIQNNTLSFILDEYVKTLETTVIKKKTKNTKIKNTKITK